MEKITDELEAVELEREISKMRNSLTTDHMDMTFGELMAMYERKELIIDPSFQRLYRWSLEQKTRFIESILLGIPIPPIFVAENRDGVWELVDGLQRISTVLTFFGELEPAQVRTPNNWKLSEGDLLPSLEGFSVKSLPGKYILNLKRAVCRVEVIKWNSQWDMRLELFNRLNTGGSALNEQEIRNCIFRGGLERFYQFINEAKRNKDFIALTDLSMKQRLKLVDEDLIVRYVSLVDDWNGVDSSITLHATTYMKKMLDAKKDISERTISRFYKCIEVLKPLSSKVFRIGSTFSPSLFDVIMVALSHYLSFYCDNVDALKCAVTELKNNADYRALRGGAGSKNRTRKKIEVALRVFEKNAR